MPSLFAFPHSTPLRSACVAVCVALLAAPLLSAQEIGRFEQIETNTAPYYFHLKPGEATTQVYVWGAVVLPGVYEVGATTDLGKLLSLAGGPATSRPVIEPGSRTSTIKLFRAEEGRRLLLYEALVEDMIEEPSAYPALRDGDVITVEIHEARGFGWRDGISLIGALAALGLAVDRLFFAN
ncbi:MAG: hypothetical protein AAGI88_18585 [Pseudomonadota bacterium]